MRKNGAPLLPDLFFFHKSWSSFRLLWKTRISNKARSFNCKFRFIDDVPFINNPNFPGWNQLIHPLKTSH